MADPQHETRPYSPSTWPAAFSTPQGKLLWDVYDIHAVCEFGAMMALDIAREGGRDPLAEDDDE